MSEPRSDDRVPLSSLVAYGPPVFALSSLLFFVQFYFLKFATDVLLLAPAAVGVVFALGRVWDAVSDPIVGTWSDRTRTRFGRRRPWMMAGVPLLALCFGFVWVQPEALGPGGRMAWSMLALFAFYSAYTVYAVPHQSLGAELTSSHHERSRVFGLYAVFFTLGVLTAFGAIQYVNNAGSPRQAAAWVSAGAALLAVGVLSWPPALLRERSEFQGRGGDQPLQAMKDVLANPHARLLLVAQFTQLLGASVIGILSPYLFEYVLDRTDLIAVLPGAFVVSSMAAVPAWVWLSRRIGKRVTWQIAMVTFGVAVGSFFFIDVGRIDILTVQLVVAGAASGCGAAVGPSMLADVIDWDELQSGERKEGAYSAAWGFAIKASNAAVILLTGVGLGAMGFVANQEQTEGAKLGLRLLYSALPFAGYGLGALVLGRYALDEAEHARIREALQSRQTEPSRPTQPERPEGSSKEGSDP
ncbi:MAG: MFS transporter [Myxococcota bacterium]